MVRLTFLLLFLILRINAQENTNIKELNTLKQHLQEKLQTLNDSIDKVDEKILFLESEQIKKKISDTTITVVVKKGAKLRESDTPFSDIIKTYSQNKKLYILSYSKYYFKLFDPPYSGYMNKMWIEKTDDVEAIIKSEKKNNINSSNLNSKQKNKRYKTYSRPSYKRKIAVQCSGRTKSGRRCRRRTTNSSGRCYQH